MKLKLKVNKKHKKANISNISIKQKALFLASIASLYLFSGSISNVKKNISIEKPIVVSEEVRGNVYLNSSNLCYYDSFSYADDAIDYAVTDKTLRDISTFFFTMDCIEIGIASSLSIQNI